MGSQCLHFRNPLSENTHIYVIMNWLSSGKPMAHYQIACSLFRGITSKTKWQITGLNLSASTRPLPAGQRHSPWTDGAGTQPKTMGHFRKTTQAPGPSPLPASWLQRGVSSPHHWHRDFHGRKVRRGSHARVALRMPPLCPSFIMKVRNEKCKGAAIQ